jgi:uncharacterized protein (DUF2236 family)
MWNCSMAASWRAACRMRRRPLVELGARRSHVTSMQQLVKRALAQQVRAVFNDQARGERPVQRRPDGLFGPGSVAWRVHGDVTTMMAGGVAALLLQMLHPAVLAGVWDHSNFRHDLHGRLRRTARFIAVTTYGGRQDAEAIIARVRSIHEHVRGHLPDGTPYHAQDPALLTWVHVTETFSFLESWIRYSQPRMPLAEQDRYFAEAAVVARGLGAGDVPVSRAETLACIDAMRPQLLVDGRTREVARLILRRPGFDAQALPFQLIGRAAVDLLPGWARRMHGLRGSMLARPVVAGGTVAMARTLRWALR